MTVAAILKVHKLVLSLRIVAVIFAVVGCCLHGWAIPQHKYVSSDGIGSLYEILPLSGFAVSFLFSVAALFVTLFSKNVHPAIYITFDLICGLLLLVVGFTVATSPISGVTSFICVYISDMECDDLSSKLAAIRWTGIILSFLNGAIHIFFFVTACATCHRRRKQSKAQYDTIVRMDYVGRAA